MAKACGARTAAGTPCKRAPVEGKARCKLHGGASTGPKRPARPVGNKNASKHGIYSRFLSDDEKEAWDGIELGKVDDELKLCRIRLMRAMRAEAAAADQPELDEITDRGAGGATFAAKEEKHKRRDYYAIVDRLTGRIESLEARRVILVQQQADIELKQRADKRAAEMHGLDVEAKRIDNERKRKEASMTNGQTTNNIMPVPTADSVDSWEQVASAQQNKALGH